MKKYWKSLTIIALILVSAIIFIISGMKHEKLVWFSFDKVEGDQTGLEQLEVYGDIYYGLSNMQTFKINSKEEMSYLKDDKYDIQSRGYFLPNKIKALLDENRSFMRGKDFYSEDYFYADQSQILYANVPLTWSGIASEIDISVLDKKSNRKTEFSLPIPSMNDYYSVEVLSVFPHGNDSLIVITENYIEEGQDEIHAYTVDIANQTLKEDENWTLEGEDNEEVYYYLEVYHNDNKEIAVVEQEMTYDDDTGQEFTELKQAIIFDIKTGEASRIDMPTSLGNIIGFDADAFYGTVEDDQQIELIKINRQTKKVEDKLELDFELSYRQDASYRTIAKMDEEMLYILYSDENEDGVPGLAVLNKAQFEKVYIGKINFNTADIAKGEYQYYFHNIDLKN